MENSKLMKKSYSRFAIAAIVFLLAAVAVQLFNNMVLSRFLPEKLTESGIYGFLNILVPEYCVGFPLLILVLLKTDKQAPEKNKFGFGRFVVCFLMVVGATGIGAVIGFLVNLGIIAPFGIKAADSNALANLMVGSNAFIRVLTVGILAPIVEELIFRKFLIDRVVKYGEWVAIITSGLMFGLFHGNFSQFFFATAIGGIFAYVYIRTGKVWYTIIYHMIINLSTSIITISLVGMIDAEKAAQLQELSKQVQASGGQDAALMQQFSELAVKVLPPIIMLYLWFGFMILLSIAGIVTWIVVLVKKKIKVQKREDQVEGGMKYAWGNVGMIIFIIGTVTLFVLNYIAMIAPAFK
ncbi:MAG: CPBP family intramembrane metalloprotease [Lachnospiraceae bacterium]|nr:CPBP family intramembrane metalloprotease [Lachnospiraceae bacterium]